MGKNNTDIPVCLCHVVKTGLLILSSVELNERWKEMTFCAVHYTVIVSELWLKQACYVVHRCPVFVPCVWWGNSVTDRFIFTGVNLWGTWATTTPRQSTSRCLRFFYEKEKGRFFPVQNPRKPQLGYPVNSDLSLRGLNGVGYWLLTWIISSVSPLFFGNFLALQI